MDTQQSLRTFLIGGVVMALVACSGSGGRNGDNEGTPSVLKSTPPALLALKTETSCEAHKSYISKSIADLILNVGVVACPACAVPLPAGAGVEAAVATDATSFDAFTGTNNQEQGVDELDQIEVDANGIFYIVDGRHLVIADGLPPADLHEIANLELTQSGYLEGLVLDSENARLVAVVSDYSFVGLVEAGILPPSEPTTELVFIDVSDPSAPVIGRHLSIEGFKLAVRRVGSRVHVVAHATPAIPAAIYDDAQLLTLRQRFADAIAVNDQATRATVTQQIRDRIDTLVAVTDAQDYLPAITLDESGTSTSIGSPICADVAVPDVTMPLAMTSITSVDSDGTNVGTLTVTNNSWNIYASEQYLYLTQTSGGWWFAELQRQQTAIFEIEIGSGTPVYRALGLIGGWLGSSFQLSEHEGHLRAVTNRSEFDPTPGVWLRDNNLYVLRDDGIGSLEVVGSVLGFGAGETIFSARMLGDRGFVVTFRQIDPLFAFDLSIPEDPRLVGELEIPGVSTYIHPLDEAHLLTIGYDGDATRLNGNFRLQIFDVQNLSDPRLVHSYVPAFGADGFAWTQATFDHLAFNYFAEAGTLTVPVQYFSNDWTQHFSGFIAFSVDTTAGFVELGRLDHSELARSEDCSGPNFASPALCDSGVYLEAASPRRSVSASFGGETFIYTLSNVGMKVSPANDFGNAAAVLPLPYVNDYWWFVAQ